jgi:hypothetical protein
VHAMPVSDDGRSWRRRLENDSFVVVNVHSHRPAGVLDQKLTKNQHDLIAQWNGKPTPFETKSKSDKPVNVARKKFSSFGWFASLWSQCKITLKCTHQLSWYQ